MRNISVAGLAKLASKQGNEPICIVEIDWVDGSTAVYADRTIGTIPGKIVEVGELDDMSSASGSSASQQVTVILDDTDGTIKALLDTHDVHKRSARLYQYFTGLAISDRFKLFSGYLATPLAWSERDRTVTVTILSQLELVETDTLVEETLPGPVPAPLLGKRFPMIFGEVENAPTVQMETPVTGALLQPVGVLAGEELLLKFPVMDTTDFDLSTMKLSYTIAFCNRLVTIFDSAVQAASSAGFTAAAATYASMRDGYKTKAQTANTSLVNAVFQQQTQIGCIQAKRQFQIDQARLLGYGANPVTILGGEFYPQGPIIVQIGNATFSGTMSGNQLTIESRSSDYLEKLAEGAYNSKMNVWDKDSPSYNPCLMNKTLVQNWGADWHASIPATNANGDYDGTAWTDWQWDLANPFMRISYTPNLAAFDNEPILQSLWFAAGSTVRLVDSGALDYLVSATPGTVTAVRAMKNVSGVQMLVDVPAYTASIRQFGSASVTVVSVPAPLSSIPDEGWTDELYVSFTSSVGPNVSDIIKYLIQTYTTQSYDPTSFTVAAQKMAAAPANFVLNDFQDVLSLIRNIAFQANCDLYFDGGVAYLRYLPVRPLSVDTITDSDVDAEHGIQVTLTPTDELVTKLTVNWSTLPVVNDEHVSQKVWGGTSYLDKVIAGLDSAALQRPKYSLVLRNNITKYGTFPATYSYYIYNDSDTVLNRVNFWFVRKSNSWKRVSFTTPLHKLKIETFDAVTLNFSQPHVGSVPILALVEAAKYDSANNCIHFQCITPVRAGTTVEDPTFWPER